MRAIFVEDDALFARHIARHLGRRRVRIEIAHTVAAGFDRAVGGACDALLLDWNFPEGNGCSLCSALRDAGFRQPIIMFTHRDDDADIVAALECGADDFVNKATSYDVLAAKLRAHVRRGPWRSLSTRTVGRIQVDEEAGHAYVEGSVLDLTKREFQLLALLAAHQGQPIARAEVLQRMWGGAPT